MQLSAVEIGIALDCEQLTADNTQVCSPVYTKASTAMHTSASSITAAQQQSNCLETVKPQVVV